jgi:hypothetical protein
LGGGEREIQGERGLQPGKRWFTEISDFTVVRQKSDAKIPFFFFLFLYLSQLYSLANSGGFLTESFCWRVNSVDSDSANLEAVSYHEAGHTVAAFRRHLRLLDVTIEPGRRFSGRVRYAKYFRKHELECDYSNRTKSKVENFTVVCLAGPEAQRKYSPESITVDWHGDQEQALGILQDYCGLGADRRAKAYYNLMEIEAQDFVANAPNWEAIGNLARVLLERRTLKGKELRDVINRCYGLSHG